MFSFFLFACLVFFFSLFNYELPGRQEWGQYSFVLQVMIDYYFCIFFFLQNSFIVLNKSWISYDRTARKKKWKIIPIYFVLVVGFSYSLVFFCFFLYFVCLFCYPLLFLFLYQQWWIFNLLEKIIFSVSFAYNSLCCCCCFFSFHFFYLQLLFVFKIKNKTRKQNVNFFNALHFSVLFFLFFLLFGLCFPSISLLLFNNKIIICTSWELFCWQNATRIGQLDKKKHKKILNALSKPGIWPLQL